MRTGKALRALVAAAPEVFASRPLKRNRCILTTACGIAALAEVGVEAEALSVHLQLVNPAMNAWAEEGFPGGEEEGRRRGAFLLETDLGRVPEPGGLSAVTRSGEWRGHLVVYVPRASALVDLDFQQLSRPERGIAVPPAVALAWPSREGRGSFELGGGMRLRVASVGGDRSFEVAPDWEADREVVADLARAMRRWKA